MRYACGACRKKFRTEGALEMHNQSKHKARIVAPAAPRNAPRGALRIIALSFFGCLLALVFAGGLLWGSNTQFAKDATPKVMKAVSSVAAWRSE
jgi:Zinc-finger of C2H2 type